MKISFAKLFAIAGVIVGPLLTMLVLVIAFGVILGLSGVNLEDAGANEPSGVRGRIVELAEKEVGYKERPGNCVKYFNVCEAWCGDFTSWIWQHAGVSVPRLPYVPNIKPYGEKTGRWKDGPANPEVGDMIIYGREHVGLVVKVENGQVSTIEGNFGDAVTRRGPFDPKQQQNPAPVSGYLSPDKVQ